MPGIDLGKSCRLPHRQHENAPMNFRPATARILTLFVAPCLLYFLLWCLLTWPLIAHFPTHIFSDPKDGMTFAWIFWWFEHAITELHQWPLWTDLLHHPYGIPLLAHHPMPVNSLPGVLLLQFLPLNQVYNVFLILAFVLSGWSAFLLCRAVSGHYGASLVGGYLFTFSAYHFAHARGHMNLVTMQWIPIFLLAWLAFLEKPTKTRAVASVGALLLVLGSDTYFFLYCVMAGAVMVVWAAWRRRDWLYLVRPANRWPGALFILLGLATAGVYVAAMFWQNRRDPFVTSHLPRSYSLDLLAPFVYSSQWRFGELTRPIWSRYIAIVNESSVHLGLSVIVSLVLAVIWRRRLAAPALGLWLALVLFFGVLAMGPRLQVAGRLVEQIPMPYALAEIIFPPLRMGGTPIRMMGMVYLAAAVVAAVVLGHLLAGSWKRKVLGLALMALLVFEQLPATPDASRPEIPPHIRVLADLAGDEPVLDMGASVEMAIVYEDRLPESLHKMSLYYQTLHQRPISFGFVARVPRGVYEQDLALLKTVLAGDYATVRETYGFRYVLLPEAMRDLLPVPPMRPLARDSHGALYDLWDGRQ